MTTPDAEIRESAASLARRARLDILSAALILAGAGGFLACVAWIDLRAGLAVLCLYFAGAGVAFGIDREGARR